MTLTAQYDDPAIYRKFEKLQRFKDGASTGVDWPTMRDYLESIRGHATLDLGCGYGWFCAWATTQGARSAHGVDNSSMMLAKAREINTASTVTYEQADLNSVHFADNSYELVYSSFALHYVENLAGLISRIHSALKPGGQLIFSVQHPIWTAPKNPKWYNNDDKQQSFWPVSTYMEEGQRETDFLNQTLRIYHRTIESYVSLLLQQGFTLKGLKEIAMPSGMVPQSNPGSGNEHHRPHALIIAATKI